MILWADIKVALELMQKDGHADPAVSFSSLWGWPSWAQRLTKDRAVGVFPCVQAVRGALSVPKGKQ